MDYALDFERPVAILENQIRELKEASQKPNINIESEIQALESKVNKLVRDIYQNLTPWERVLLSRHPQRPHTVDYIDMMFTDFHEVHGDRHFADDSSIIAGFGYMNKQKFAIVGIEKGRKTKEKVHRNFGMPKPEGYRKALRVMKLASQFSIPILSFIDTPGAYPGIGAEERGQSSAIAENLAEMFDLKVPIIATVIGEGGSGGALGIAIADKVLMQEYSVYSVISPESCASILWSDSKKAETAANALQLVPSKALEFKVIDEIICEPAGGGHRFPQQAADAVRDSIMKSFSKIEKLSTTELLDNRFKKFRQMGNLTIEKIKTNSVKG